jgi:hypothetical protein
MKPIYQHPAWLCRAPRDAKESKMESKFTLADDIRELTFAELDEVSGSRADVSASLVGDAIVNGSFHLDNLPGVFSIAQISGTITPFSGSPTLTLNARADTFN